MLLSILLSVSLLGTSVAQVDDRGDDLRLDGVAVNGTRQELPLVGAEVLLRAGPEGALQVVAKTVTDRNGHFAFGGLSAEPGLIYLAGVNHHGIHYPGPRMRLPVGAGLHDVKLTAFDAVSSPNPLIAEIHEVEVNIQKEILEVVETLRISNPSATTYVGQAESGSFSTTLSLTIPDGFERVTFSSEFNGRHFKLRDKRLVTDIPWTPGQREVKFAYQLPLEHDRRVLEWSANITCSRYRMVVRGENAERHGCSLPRLPGTGQEVAVFESSGTALEANQIVKLELGGVSATWIVYARWSAVAVLVVLVLMTAVRFTRRVPPKTAPLAAARSQQTASVV